ncbi:SMI1/KNR4 family protein [Sporosarcina sp. HYO08]|uniref:SMI1/KNR4 family protein n=1 Tax=Sporosarcina sp. HYO08 TaxID=1759557 RepID=UPI00079C037C|nr:SMI1/KNR4 family protein [Sporosarcina sp. HYO08]KXH86074.1 cell wall assembly protein [Sporosarcina sp. HYO08]
MWKDYIQAVAKGYYFKPPAIKSEIDQLEKELQVELPTDLLELFKETNGVYDKFDCPLIWPTDQIVKDNLFFRNFDDYKDIYMPFDHLLFFSDAGNGDLFGYAILNGSVRRDDIFVWDHESDSRKWVASSLKDFIEGWTNDKIAV